MPLKVIALNANGTGRQRHEVNKQLQDLNIDVALFSKTHLKPHDIQSIATRKEKAELPSQSEKAFPT
jgi:hypothetical protein